MLAERAADRLSAELRADPGGASSGGADQNGAMDNPSEAPTSAQSGRPSIVLELVVLDTDDPAGLADFYARLLGWRVDRNDDGWVTVRNGSGPGLAFQAAPGHKQPTWPREDVPQQFHLDLHVPDLEEAAAFAESVGATRVPPQPGQPDDFIVFTDPSGHPFCLCKAEGS